MSFCMGQDGDTGRARGGTRASLRPDQVRGDFGKVPRSDVRGGDELYKRPESDWKLPSYQSLRVLA